MPELEEIDEERDLILVERQSLLMRKEMVLHFPREIGPGYKVGLMKHNSTFVETFPLAETKSSYQPPSAVIWMSDIPDCAVEKRRR